MDGRWERFGGAEVIGSICAENRADGQFTESLEAIAEKLAERFVEPSCLGRPLRRCSSDADCGTEVSRQAAVRVMFIPGAGERGHGCFEFLEGGGDRPDHLPLRD